MTVASAKGRWMNCSYCNVFFGCLKKLCWTSPKNTLQDYQNFFGFLVSDLDLDLSLNLWILTMIYPACCHEMETRVPRGSREAERICGLWFKRTLWA